MNIVAIDLNDEIRVTIGYYDYSSAEDIQEALESDGSLEEKVIGLIKLSDDDPLGDLFTSLCGFASGYEDSFQCMFEEFLTKIFQLGKEMSHVQNGPLG